LSFWAKAFLVFNPGNEWLSDNGLDNAADHFAAFRVAMYLAISSSFIEAIFFASAGVNTVRAPNEAAMSVPHFGVECDCPNAGLE
jgi:hypothetical protein